MTNAPIGESPAESGNTDTSQAQMDQQRTQTAYDMTHGTDRGSYRDEKGQFTDNTGRLHATETQIETARKEMEDALNNTQMDQQRAQTAYDMTHGTDRATYRDADGKFTDNSGRLHATETQIEAARKEMEDELNNTQIDQNSPIPVEEETEEIAENQDDGNLNTVKQKITLESIREAIESGSELKVKVERASGEIEDDWTVSQVFTEHTEDGKEIERARVVKFDSKTGQRFIKNVLVEDLERWNNQETEAPTFETQEPESQVQQETSAEASIATGLDQQEQDNTSPKIEKLKELIVELNKLTQTLVELKTLLPNNPQIQQAIINIMENITIITAESANELSGTLGQQPSNEAIEIPEAVTPGAETSIPGEVDQSEIPTIETPDGTATATVEQGAQDTNATVEETWEQKVGKINREIERLDKIRREERLLTDAEKIQYFDLLARRDDLSNLMIAPIEQENLSKRNRKEKWITRGAGVVGFGVAVLTPAVPLAAMIAIGLGGPIIGKGLKAWGEKLRSQSTAMKYADRSGMSPEELEKFDKKEKRKEWWANRLGEAAAIVTGGAIGYGLGKAAKNIFGMFKGAGANTTSAATQTPTTGTEATGNAQVGQGTIQQPPTQAPQPIPTQGHIDTTPLQGTFGQGGGGELPNTISFADNPLLKEGLVKAGMDSSANHLTIDPLFAKGSWADYQRQIVQLLQNQGIDINSRAAGYTVGELSRQAIYSGEAITPDTLSKVYSAAQATLGS